MKRFRLVTLAMSLLLVSKTYGTTSHLCDAVFLCTSRFKNYNLGPFSPYLFGYMLLVVLLLDSMISKFNESQSFVDMVYYRSSRRKGIDHILKASEKEIVLDCLTFMYAMIVLNARESVEELLFMTRLCLELTFILLAYQGICSRFGSHDALLAFALMLLVAIDNFSGSSIITYTGSMYAETIISVAMIGMDVLMYKMIGNIRRKE